MFNKRKLFFSVMFFLLSTQVFVYADNASVQPKAEEVEKIGDKTVEKVKGVVLFSSTRRGLLGLKAEDGAEMEFFVTGLEYETVFTRGEDVVILDDVRGGDSVEVSYYVNDKEKLIATKVHIIEDEEEKEADL